MTYYWRERIFWLAMVVMIVLYTDVWTWDKLHPILFGWLPFEMWYRILLTLLCFGLFWWLSAWAWPEPKGELLERTAERKEDKSHG